MEMPDIGNCAAITCCDDLLCKKESLLLGNPSVYLITICTQRGR